MTDQILPITAVEFDPQNARKRTERSSHMIRNSLQQFGPLRSLVGQRLPDGRIIVRAGNGTLEEAGQIGIDKIRVIERRPDELVVVVANDLDESQWKSYAIADNRSSDLSEWDVDVLAELQQDVDLSDWFLPDEMTAWSVGFDDPQISDKEDEENAADLVEKVSEGAIQSRVKPGEIWALGRHRIACGDSTDEGNVRRLLEGIDFGAIVFDPPWDAGISISQFNGYPSTFAFSDMQRMSDIIKCRNQDLRWTFVWDCVSSWYTPSCPLKRAKCCLWYASKHIKYDFDGAHYGDPLSPRTVTNSRGSYEFNGDERGKHLADVFSTPITRLHSESEHSHCKPVDWVKMIIANCSAGNVFDPFLGSGTTIIAVQNIPNDRAVYGFELSPDYCEVVLRRWEQFTGGVAELAGYL